MKKIAVILPVNNFDILKQDDLLPFQSDDYFFTLHYVDTHLRELNTADEAAQVSKLTFEKAEQVVSDKAAAVIIYAFGEFGFEKELEEKLSVPVLTLGEKAIHKASSLSQKKFTILPGMLAHNGFLEGFVSGMRLQKNNYQLAKNAPEISPAQIRGDKKILDKLVVLASREIRENNIDTFTLGCGSFIGIAKPLQDLLRKEFGNDINVVDPIAITFDFVKSQLDFIDNDLQKIREIVDLYFNGTYYGNSDQVKLAFYSGARITGIINGQMHDWSLTDFIARVTAVPTSADKGEEYDKKILSIDKTNNAAMVKARVIVGDLIFIDYITLLKINSQWVIRNKAFTTQH